MDALQARQLVLNGGQMLKRAEGRRRQLEGASEIEIAHIGLHELDPGPDVLRFTQQAIPAHVQHVRGQVEADDFDASPRCGDQDTTGATTELENRASRLCGGLDEESDVRAIAVGDDVVVQVGYERVLVTFFGLGHG
jgi:hypothetical protein